MTARITLALLVIIPAVMTYPWHTTQHKWILGVAVAVVLLVFAWWRGMFLTTMVARRFAVWRRNRRGAARTSSGQVTVVLEADEFPYDALPLVTSYVDRYGVRCDSVRVTERRLDGARSAWVSVTVAAASNLAALQARSPELPLADTAERWPDGWPTSCAKPASRSRSLTPRPHPGRTAHARRGVRSVTRTAT